MYLIGLLQFLQNEFPDHDFSHARTSIPGDEVVFAQEVTADQQLYLEANNVFCLNHSETLEYLNDPLMDGIWHQNQENGQ